MIVQKLGGDKHFKIGLALDDTLDKPDGVQQYVLTLGAWLTDQGHEVHYLTGQTERTDLSGVHSMSKNVRVRFNGNRLSVPLPTSSAKIRQLLSDEQFDVLHVQMPHSPFMAAKLVRIAHPKTAIIGTFHIAPYAKFDEQATHLLGLALRRNLRLFDEIISVSSTAQSFAKRTFGITTRVVSNAVDVSAFKNNIKKQKSQIVTLGRLVPRKGCLELLKAYKLLWQKHQVSIPLIICGDGPMRSKLEDYCAKHKLASVKFVGYVSEADKKHYLAESAYTVFPSTRGESFGIVLLEAMASGSGVVLAGDNPGYVSVLGSVPEAMIDPIDTEAFAQKLANVITNDKLADSIRKKQQTLLNQYDIHQVGPKVMDCYMRAIAKKRTSKHN